MVSKVLPPPGYVTVADFAKSKNVTRASAEYWLNANKVPYVKVGAKRFILATATPPRNNYATLR